MSFDEYLTSLGYNVHTENTQHNHILLTEINRELIQSCAKKLTTSEKLYIKRLDT